MDLREVFATNRRRWRNARGLSQDDLTYEAGVSRSYLSQLEKGEPVRNSNPRPTDCRRRPTPKGV